MKHCFKKLILLLILVQVFSWSTTAFSQSSSLLIEFEQPKLAARPYFKPYVAVWLETPKREYVATVALWYQLAPSKQGEGEGSKWLKDLRQWWRKTDTESRKNIDSVTGATRKPGNYKVAWDGNDDKGVKVADGDYVLCFEAAREEGGREFIRIPISLGAAGSYQKQGDSELGKISITTSN